MTTLTEIEAIPKMILTPQDVADYLSVDPQLIRLQARKEPHKLGFPVIVVGSRTKIPKEGFIKYCRGDKHDTPNKA